MEKIIHHGAVITMEKKREANRTGYAMGENGGTSLLRWSSKVSVTRWQVRRELRKMRVSHVDFGVKNSRQRE